MIIKNYRLQSVYRLSSILVILFVLSIAFQNCGEQFQTQKMEDLSFASVSSGITPSAKNCFEETQHQACVFAKSPVSQSGRSMNLSDLIKVQNHGVQLPNLIQNQQLASTDISVVNDSKSIYASSVGWKIKDNQQRELSSAVSAYFYAQDFKNWLKSLSGQTHLDNKGLKIVISQNLDAGYYHPQKEIILSIDEEHIPMGYDGTALTGFMAQAFIAYASSGKILINQSASTNECRNNKGQLSARGCCKTNALCGPALLQGSADFLSALYFSKWGNTSLSDGWINNPEGFKHCQILRDPSKNANLTSTGAFQACADRSSLGYVPVMASLYSSIWWEARKNASNTSEFDAFFFRHLALLGGEENWTTLKPKLTQLLATEPQWQSSYNLLLTEINRRGLL